MRSLTRTLLLTALLLLCLAATPRRAQAFAYIFAGEANGVDLVTHPLGYTGSGGVLSISVGIDPTSVNATSMVIPTQNIIRTWNGLVPTTSNLVFGANNNVPSGAVDFESALLHEMGHSLGLAHINLASESGLSGPSTDYTKSTNGINDTFDVNPGADGVIGTADDLRGDDVNLNYFRIANNDPFSIDSVVDSTTYSRNTALLPVGDNYSANAGRAVAATMAGVPDNTEAAMQQGQFLDEAQRTLGHDDVAGIRYAMAGLDELQGTSDDYSINLLFAGLTTAADIVVDFDNSQTSFAVSQASGQFISPDHARITSTAIYFNDLSSQSFGWFFNQESNAAAVPEPSSLALAALAGLSLAGSRLRRRRKRDT